MGKRLAAYGYLFFAGIMSACLGIAVRGGRRFIAEILVNPAFGLSPVLLAGMAAVIGAWVVRKPFLRAVWARRRLPVYGCVALGVIAAHLAYVPFIFLFLEMAVEPPMHTLEYFKGAMVFGADAVMLGFVPNTAFGICLAELLLARNRRAGWGEAETGSAGAQRA